MHPDPLSRRGFVGALAVGGGATWLAASWSDLLAAGTHAARAGQAASPPPFAVFTREQAAEVEAIAALVIPTDETPGAREARVVYFIDRGLATFAKDERKAFEDGLTALRAAVAKRHRGATSFAALTERQQLAMLRAMERADDRFFQTVRGMTIAGMFANPEYGGNFQKAGWRLLGFQDRFSWAAPFGYYDRV